MKMLRQLERQGHGFAIGKIWLDFRAGRPQSEVAVMFELSIGSQSLGSIAIPASEIGVPLGFGEAKSLEAREDHYRLPDRIFDFARATLPPDQPLYLVFETPSGYLPGIPWEKLGTARFGRPIVRLGAAPVQPVRSERTWDVAYCCSLPAGEGSSPQQIVEELILQIPADLPRRARLHVFVDAELHPLLEQRVVALGLGDTVRLYAPAAAEQFANPRPSTTEMVEANELENPWLLWMRDALRNLSLDGVHFITPGYLGRARPGLRFANSPVQDFENTCTRIVGARQLAIFLEQVGAWAVAFSSPPANASILGLRMLFDEVSRMITGPAILHDIAADTDGTVLRQAYWHIFAPDATPLPSSPALALATHPSWAGAAGGTRTSDRVKWLVGEYTLRNRVGSLTGEADTPAWVSAQQRRLEKTIVGVSQDPETEQEQAQETGVLDALKFTSELIAKYADQGSTGSGDGGKP